MSSVKLIVPMGRKVLTSNCTHLVRSCFKIAFLKIHIARRTDDADTVRMEPLVNLQLSDCFNNKKESKKKNEISFLFLYLFFI